MKQILSLFLLILPFYSYGVDCEYSEILSMQAQKGDILIQLQNDSGAVWKHIGLHSEPFTKSYQSLVQQALAANFKILLRFEDGHDCNATDYDTSPIVLRIYK